MKPDTPEARLRKYISSYYKFLGGHWNVVLSGHCSEAIHSSVIDPSLPAEKVEKQQAKELLIPVVRMRGR